MQSNDAGFHCETRYLLTCYSITCNGRESKNLARNVDVNRLETNFLIRKHVTTTNGLIKKMYFRCSSSWVHWFEYLNCDVTDSHNFFNRSLFFAAFCPKWTPIHHLNLIYKITNSSLITHTWIKGSALWYRFKSQYRYLFSSIFPITIMIEIIRTACSIIPAEHFQKTGISVPPYVFILEGRITHTVKGSTLYSHELPIPWLQLQQTLARLPIILLSFPLKVTFDWFPKPQMGAATL